MLIELTRADGGKVAVNHTAIEILYPRIPVANMYMLGESGNVGILESPAEVNAKILAAIKAEHTARLEAEAEFAARGDLTVAEVLEYCKRDSCGMDIDFTGIQPYGDRQRTIEELTAIVRARD
jgi:hypothetical protein